MHTVGPNGDVTVEKKGRDGSCSAPTAPAVHKRSSGEAGAVTWAGSVCEKLSGCLFMIYALFRCILHFIKELCEHVFF